MQQIINIVQMVSAVLMVVLILLQQRGGGLSGALGGGDTTSSYSSRRGVEKHILRGTIALAVIFLGSAVLQFILL
jgi:protein translocase SecG subunit